MSIVIDLKLAKEIEDYCKLNEIEDVCAFANKLLRSGFTIEKFGISPTPKGPEMNIVRKPRGNGMTKTSPIIKENKTLDEIVVEEVDKKDMYNE